jgi:hypothetical protein
MAKRPAALPAVMAKLSGSLLGSLALTKPSELAAAFSSMAVVKSLASGARRASWVRN